MMNAAPHALHHRLTVEEYLDFEERADVRHEYVDGVLYAMVGATERHALIVGNIFANLWGAARKGPCRVLMSEVKLRASNDAIYYPDVMLVCDSADRDPLIKTRPVFIAEILSPSTSRTDRHEKLMAYRGIGSLQAYAIVHQDRQLVEWHQRDSDGAWKRVDIGDDEGMLIPHLDLELTLEDVYVGIDLQGDEESLG